MNWSWLTLCAPKNVCAKPQCYFSLAMSRLTLHAHASCASFPCSPIFTAFLCTEHNRITPLTYHTSTNLGRGSKRERSGVGSSKLTTDWVAMQKKSKRISFLSRHTKCLFLSWRPLQASSSSPSHLHSTSATHFPCSLCPLNLVLLLSSQFPPIYFPLASLVKSLEQKLPVSTWKVPEISLSPTANKQTNKLQCTVCVLSQPWNSHLWHQKLGLQLLLPTHQENLQICFLCCSPPSFPHQSIHFWNPCLTFYYKLF